MVDVFSDNEKKMLGRFCSNSNRDVFVLRNMPESVKGALFSRYSRSAKPLRRLLLDEFLSNPDLAMDLDSSRAVAVNSVDTAKANAFFERVLDGYGDDSVGELGGCHVAFENISILATKEIEDARIGGSPLEKSTRYVYFDQKVGGEYLFLREPRLMASKHRDLFLETCNDLFDTYARLVKPMSAWMEGQFPAESFLFTVDTVTREERKLADITDEAVKKRALTAYKAALRANVCDILRYLLPTATLTNMGVYGNGRFFEYLLRRIYSHPLSEMNGLGTTLRAELDTEIPAFVRRAKKDEYLVASRHDFKSAILPLAPMVSSTSPDRVVLADFDSSGELSVLAAILYSASGASMADCRAKAASLTTDMKKKAVAAYVGTRRTRRDRPGRAFENAFFEFDIACDYGGYRDIHRHRLLTQERQYFSPHLGYELPAEILHTEFEAPMRKAIENAADAFKFIARDFPLEAQYVVPFAYRIRFRMKLNLREAIHFCELRSVKQGHASYREVAQQMAKSIMRATPLFKDCFAFVDFNDYHLGRLAAEMSQEHKRAKWAGQ